MTKINKLELELSKDNKIKVTKEDVIDIVSRKSNIPIYKLKSFDIKDVYDFEKKLKDKIIGHDKNIDELVKVYKKLKLGLKDDNMCYSMLFTGSSGVGKTNLAKLFGNNISNNVIKLDMSEFSEPHSISKLLGSPAGYVGYDDNKNILESIKDNPFSVLILDEIEKAHPNVLNLLYQILDDGKLKDSKGETIYFNNCTIIMTSNIGYNKKNIGFNNDNKVNNELKETFSIPFINRIDSIFNFNNLNEDNIRKIIKINLDKLKDKYKQKNIKIKINNRVIDEIVKLSNYIEYGARKIEKIIKNNIESIVINQILEGKTIVNINELEKSIIY